MARFGSDSTPGCAERIQVVTGVVYADLGCDVAKRVAHGIADAGKQHQTLPVHQSGMGKIRPAAEKIEIAPVPKISGLFAVNVTCGSRLYGATIVASGS